MPFKAYYLNPDGDLQRELKERDISKAFKSGKGLLWVDINETKEEDGRFLEQTCHFHPLAIGDCVSPLIHPPKIDDFSDYMFIVVHGINHISESEIVETAELAIFLGPNFVVSNHNFPLYSVEAVRQRLEDNDSRPMQGGPDLLTYTLIDTLVNYVLPTIDRMGEVADQIEEGVIRNPQQSMLEAILKVKRSVQRVHRIIAPQREVLNRLSRGEFSLITQQAQVFYRDIYDRMVRIEDFNQTVRDTADNTLSLYLSSVANRQNETMRVLSIVAAILLPLTLISGIYGMNFNNMPELDWPWGYFAVLGFMGAIIIVTLWWFWARGWINWGRKQATWSRLFTVNPQKLNVHMGWLKSTKDD